MIALVPQAVVPAARKMLGEVAEPAWFVAVHAPPPWQWPVIAAMALVGSVLLFAAYRTYRGETDTEE